MRTFRGEGNRVVWKNATSAEVKSGDVVVLGTKIGVVVDTTAPGTDAVVEIVREHELPAVATEAWTIGAKLYWDATNKVLTATAGTNAAAGTAMRVKTAGQATSVVKLNF